MKFEYKNHMSQITDTKMFLKIRSILRLRSIVTLSDFASVFLFCVPCVIVLKDFDLRRMQNMSSFIKTRKHFLFSLLFVLYNISLLIIFVYVCDLDTFYYALLHLAIKRKWVLCNDLIIHQFICGNSFLFTIYLASDLYRAKN